MCIYPVNIKTVKFRDFFNRKSVRSDWQCELKHQKNHMPDEHSGFSRTPAKIPYSCNNILRNLPKANMSDIF